MARDAAGPSPGAGARARRLLLAAASPEALPESLLALRRLAAGLEAELAGLFVEDATLLRLAALPFTREVGRFSGALLELEPAEVERRLRRQAARMQDALAALGAELALPWRFEVTRGGLVEGALAAGTEADVLILVARATGWRTAPPPLPAAARRTVATLFDASPQALRALDTALELAEGLSERLVLLTPPELGGETERLRREAAARLPDGPPRLLGLAQESPGSLGAQVLALRPRALVLPASRLPPSPATLERLLERLGCPVVVVR